MADMLGGLADMKSRLKKTQPAAEEEPETDL